MGLGEDPAWNKYHGQEGDGDIEPFTLDVEDAVEFTHSLVFSARDIKERRDEIIAEGTVTMVNRLDEFFAAITIEGE